MDFRIAVVDDVRRDAEKLQQNIHRWFTENYSSPRTITCFADGEGLLNSFEPQKYHIVFLDILMNKLNGIQTAERLRKFDNKTLLIFTTSSREFALEAFPLHPFDYLVKPYETSRLGRVLREAVSFLDSPEPSITVRVSRSNYEIPLRKISAILSHDHTVEVVMSEGNCLLCSMKFSEFEEILKDDKRFLICNRGIIINMDYTASLTRNKDLFIMEDGYKYPVKIRGRAKIIEQFTQYQISRIRREAGGAK